MTGNDSKTNQDQASAIQQEIARRVEGKSCRYQHFRDDVEMDCVTAADPIDEWCDACLLRAAGSPQGQAVIDAVLYALREGCFFPVPEPPPGATTQELIQWGAMRNLHSAIRDYTAAPKEDA